MILATYGGLGSITALPNSAFASPEMGLGGLYKTQDDYGTSYYYCGNHNYYLQSANDYWTMTPGYFMANIAGVYGVNSDRDLVPYYDQYQMSALVHSLNFVRPVIALKANTIVSSGNGTIASPYIIN